MAKPRVLIVEDDPSLLDVLDYNLQQEGYGTRLASDGQQALQEIRRCLPDLVVLDLMLPLVDGLEVCRIIRADPCLQDLLILMLTARSEESDQIAGFTMGADDYVTKPFSIKILLQRVRVLLRRNWQEKSDQEMIVSQGILIDRHRHRVAIDEMPVDLTPSEFALLTTLVRHPGRAFSRAELIDGALGDDAIVLDRTIDVHIRSLRKKMGTHAELIQTVRGIGYRLRDPSDVAMAL